MPPQEPKELPSTEALPTEALPRASTDEGAQNPLPSTDEGVENPLRAEREEPAWLTTAAELLHAPSHAPRPPLFLPSGRGEITSGRSASTPSEGSGERRSSSVGSPRRATWGGERLSS